MRLTARLLGPVVLLLGHVTAAPAQTFTVFDAPNALLMVSSSINAQGDVTGSFQDGSQFDKRRSFVRDPFGNITVFDAPGSFPLGYGPQTATFSTSINAGGAVTGYFRDPSQGGKTRGFVRDAAGNITVFDAPDGLFTTSSSINAGGDVTGSFLGTGSKQHGFVRDAAGNFTVFDPPNAADFGTVSASINARGDITGYFNDVSQNLRQRGFVRDRNGNSAVFDAPNALWTVTSSINARGDVTGYFLDASQGKQRGFVRSAH